MANLNSNSRFVVDHGAGTPDDPNLASVADLATALLIDSTAISAATSKAVSTVSAAAPDSANLSTADSKAVSAGGRASVADSKAVSGSGNTSVADSKAISVSGSCSIADSKAVSVQNSVPILTVVANSQNVSTAQSKAESAAAIGTTANSRAVSDATATSVADSKATSVATAVVGAVPANGRTVTSLSAYLGNNAFFNVYDYGATGDGAADDVTKIQAAITAATAGDEVSFPRGTFKVSTTLNWNKLLKFRGAAIGEGGGVAAVSGAKITGTGLTLVRATESFVMDGLCITDPTGDAATIALDVDDGATGVVNWVVRNAYIAGQFAKLGTGLRDLFALKGVIDSSVIEGWAIGIDLQSSGLSLSNANQISGCKIRVNTVGLKTTAIDDVFVSGCTIEGNGTGIKHESGKLNVTQTHFEQNVGVIRDIHITGGNLVSLSNGFYSLGGSDLDIYVESGSGSHLSVGDTFSRGIKHNGSGIFLIINPVNGDPTVSGTGTVVRIDGTGMRVLQGSQTLNLSGYTYIATALAILNAAGASGIGGLTGVQFLNGSATPVGTVSATGAAVFNAGVTAGSAGTALTQGKVYSPSLTPASVAAAVTAEQTFTVTGLTTADKVIVNPPAIANATGIAGARVSAADTLAIRFVNPTAGALTPTAGTYTILTFRS